MHQSKSFLLFVVVSLLVSTAFTGTKPKILIIGDSISIGYTPYVEQDLSEKAIIVHNPGNAQHTATGLDKIEDWLGEEKWDVIQFNWGLWDLCYRHPAATVYGNRDKVNGTLTHTLEEYAANLDALVTILKRKTDAQLIFVTTTYVPKGEAGRFQKDAIKYNRAAKKVMKKHGVSVNDIYKKSKAIHKKFGKKANDVHYTPEGYEQLGTLVSQFIEQPIAR